MPKVPEDYLKGVYLGRKRRGRPSKNTKETRAIILKAIEIGMPFEHACKIGRLSHDQFERWRRDNAEFAADVDKAEASFIQRSLERIQAAIERGVWPAAAWTLERRYPQYFALRQTFTLEAGVVSEMEKRLSAGRERISRERRTEELASESVQ